MTRTRSERERDGNHASCAAVVPHTATLDTDKVRLGAWLPCRGGVRLPAAIERHRLDVRWLGGRVAMGVRLGATACMRLTVWPHRLCGEDVPHVMPHTAREPGFRVAMACG